MPSASIEDYIKTIYALESKGQKTSTSRIARELDVTMASVTGRIKQLAAEGYLNHRPYYGVTLTGKGKRIALATLRHHRLIELFLVKTLGLSWDEVHADAEILEHAFSPKLIERIYEFLGRPEFDPHGAPIPKKNGTIRRVKARPLTDLKEGASGKVLRVADGDPEFLRYLTSIGLSLGTRVTLTRRDPFDGPLNLRAGKRNVRIGPHAAERILVSPN